MLFPKLTPRQSRFAATLAATLLLVILYFVLFAPQFAYAAELVLPGDRHCRLQTQDYSGSVNEVQCTPELNDYWDEPEEDGDAEGREYENESSESAVAARTPAGLTSLGNNQFQQSNIKIGETQSWVFPKEAVTGPKFPSTSGLPAYLGTSNTPARDQYNSHELKRRGSSSSEDLEDLPKRSTTVYISLTTCLKPSLNTTSSDNDVPFPQLEVYISSDDSLQNPGPGISSSSQAVYQADGGYMNATLEATGDVYISVAAPNSTSFSGIYSYELAASIDGYFHQVDTLQPFLFFVDSDDGSALLVTNNVTQSTSNTTNYKEWMEITPPFTIFASNTNDSSIWGLEKSFCALNQLAQIGKGNGVQGNMTNRGLGGKPKEQFYVTGLNRSSTYYGFLAMDGNSTNSGNGVVGGGGKVWKQMNFTTKAGMLFFFFIVSLGVLVLTRDLFLRLTEDDNCALLFNLSFCSEVAYAVPSNPSLNISELTQIYDTNASALYMNFSYSLQQIQCNTSAESSYSLAVSCNDCASAYKKWLCAVTIPRCYDFSSSLPFLQPRNAGQPFLNGTSITDNQLTMSPITNASRNPIIDNVIRPGPYKEILPCQDLCYDLARTCPAALAFRCPTGKWLNASYGVRNPNGDITCNYLGAAYYLNSAWSFHDRTHVLLYAVAAFWVFLWA